MRYRASYGFTIVELLIVIVVIGILAAITIVAFNGVQERANSTTAQSDFASIGKKIEIFKIDNNRYPRNSELPGTGITASKAVYLTGDDRNNFYYCLSEDEQTYALGALTKNNQGYMLINGKVNEHNTGVWGSITCEQAGWSGDPGETGSPASGWITGSPSAWANWVKG